MTLSILVLLAACSRDETEKPQATLPETTNRSAPSAEVNIHGGQVARAGEVLVEYIGEQDNYQFWFTDPQQVAITSRVSGTVTDGDLVLPLAFEPTQGLLRAQGVGAGTRPVTLEAAVGDRSLTLSFERTPRRGEGDGHVSHEHKGSP